jgi:hypothetical protein
MAEAHVNVGVNVDVNVELERLLARAGWTPEDLGDQLNRLASTAWTNHGPAPGHSTPGPR